MKTYKILDSKNHTIACYVNVSKEIFDGSWYALKLARNTIDKDLCTTQLLDVKRGEEMIEGVPVLEYMEEK